jgi:glycosyltransferase involved in cell wall biosynthesis
MPRDPSSAEREASATADRKRFAVQTTEMRKGWVTALTLSSALSPHGWHEACTEAVLPVRMGSWLPPHLLQHSPGNDRRQMSARRPRAETPGTMRLMICLHEGAALGSGISIARVLPALKEQGWTVGVVFAGDGPLVDVFENLADETAVIECPVAFSLRGLRRAPGVVRRIRTWPSYRRDLEAFTRRFRPHIVHCNTALSLPQARIIGRATQLPVLLHIHESLGGSRKGRWTARVVASAADVVVAVSHETGAILTRHTQSVRIIHNGVPLPGADSAPQERTALRIGTLGAISHRKATDLFVTLAERFASTDLEFEHAGPHSTSGDDLFDAGVRDRGHRAGVHFLGHVPANDAFARWDVFVMPSRDDPHPLAVMEAMAAGLPVVATHVGGIPEQIDHEVDGLLVAAESVDALERSVRTLVDEPSVRRKLGSAARRKAETEFSLGRQAQQLHEAYLEAIARRWNPWVKASV